MELRGKQLGDYLVLDEIGSGGMGQVFLARNIHHGKQYALKVLPPDLADAPGFRERFFDEARVMSELEHPNIVRVHHMGVHEGVYYLVMDYVTGADGKPRTLHDRIESSPDRRVGEEQARHWITQVARGLGHAHAVGVVHRDIKPGNVLLTKDDEAKVTDFGLVKAVGAEFLLREIRNSLSLGDQRTMLAPAQRPAETPDILDVATTLGREPTSPQGSTGRDGILGTYDYMSPEQRAGDAVDCRSDIYSLGIMAYLLLTGKRPTGIAKLPSQVVPGLSKKWDAITRKCLADDPDERYPSAQTLLTDLKRVSPAGSKVRGLIWAVAVAVVVGGLSFAVVLVSRGRFDTPERPPSGSTPTTPPRPDTLDKTPAGGETASRLAQGRGDVGKAQTAAESVPRPKPEPSPHPSPSPKTPDAHPLLGALEPESFLTVFVTAGGVDERRSVRAGLTQALSRLNGPVSFVEAADTINSRTENLILDAARTKKVENLVFCQLTGEPDGEREVYGRKMSYFTASLDAVLINVASEKQWGPETTSVTRGSSSAAKARLHAARDGGQKAGEELRRYMCDSAR